MDWWQCRGDRSWTCQGSWFRTWKGSSFRILVLIKFCLPFFIYGEADVSAALVCLLLLLSTQELKKNILCFPVQSCQCVRSLSNNKPFKFANLSLDLSADIPHQLKSMSVVSPQTGCFFFLYTNPHIISKKSSAKIQRTSFSGSSWRTGNQVDAALIFHIVTIGWFTH